MYAYLFGKVESLYPTKVVIDVNGLAFDLHISLYTYENIKGQKEAKLFTHLYMREDIHTILMYGFATEEEKTLFLKLTSVSGIGMNTAQVILSSLPPDQIKVAIVNEDAESFKRIKGIGKKTAERIILDLKDKMEKLIGDHSIKQVGALVTLPSTEAVNALVSLGFNKTKAEKVVVQVAKPEMEIETILKLALNLLS